MLLQVKDVSAGYSAVGVLHGISLEVSEGETVAVLGANGAGKSTLLRSVSNLIPISGGQILFDGRPLEKIEAHEIARLGLIQVPEARHVFPELTVRENLLVGGTALSNARLRAEVLDEMYDLFPILKQRRNQTAGTLSGGQQQMLAIGRALMGRPRLLMLDEPSLGLAPLIVRELYETISRLIDGGLTVLLVEQDVGLALEAADRAYVLENGRIALAGSAAELRNNDHIQRFYLGL